MSLKNKVFAAAATLTLIGGIGAVEATSAVTANAATPSCGVGCIDPFSFQFGTHHTPNYVMDVFRQGEKVGQPIILFRTSNEDPAEDFTASYQGQVSAFYAAGLVSAAVDLHYGGGCENEGVTTPVLAAPAEPALTHTGSGTVAAGTYKAEVTYVNGSGETVASLPATVTLTAAGRITIHRPAAISGASAWNAYVTQAGGSTYTLQNASPIALGANLAITAPPTSSGANPPATNTAATGGAPVTACTSYYPNLYAWELQYSPYGVDSGLCVGVASTAVTGEKVTLQPCGTSSKTVLITDTVNAAGWGSNYVPVIDGSDTNFSQPLVLDYPHNGFPTDAVRPQLYVDNLTGFSTGSILNPTGVLDTQEWGIDAGVLP